MSQGLFGNVVKLEKLGSAITIETRTTMPQMQPSVTKGSEDLRILKLHEYKEAAQTLAEAFWEDDVAMYFIETGDRILTTQQKWDLHVSILEKIVYAHCLKGLVTTVGPNYQCVALWLPPGTMADDFFTKLRSGLWRLGFELSAEGKKRFFDEFLPLLHETKKEVLGELDNNSWYLVYIGTKTSSRGQGFAKTLINDIKEQADTTGHTIYLESSNEHNPVIYEKLGFERVKKIHLKRAQKPVELDVMVRHPCPLAAGRSTGYKGGQHGTPLSNSTGWCD